LAKFVVTANVDAQTSVSWAQADDVVQHAVDTGSASAHELANHQSDTHHRLIRVRTAEAPVVKPVTVKKVAAQHVASQRSAVVVPVNDEPEEKKSARLERFGLDAPPAVEPFFASHGQSGVVCHKCGQPGHTRPQCRSKNVRPRAQAESEAVPESEDVVESVDAQEEHETVPATKKSKFVPTCHHCHVEGHTRPKCPLLALDTPLAELPPITNHGKGIVCHHCKKPGHTRPHCFLLKKQTRNQQ
jgi:hypothetical protein